MFRWKGLILGFLGILGFSGTLPATKFALAGGVHPYVLMSGRIVIAGLLGLLSLLLFDRRLPTRAQFKSIVIVTLTYVLPFPVLISFALRNVMASHAAVLMSIQPLLTALFSVLRNREYPSKLFWISSAAGAGANILYFLHHANGVVNFSDLMILVAILCSCFGYVDASRASSSMGGFRVTAWSVVLVLPFAVPGFLWALQEYEVSRHTGVFWTDFKPLLGILYVGCISQFGATIPWIRGLALGGAARVGQIQLLQPFMTLVCSWFLLGDPITLEMLIAASAVLVCVALATTSRRRLMIPKKPVVVG